MLITNILSLFMISRALAAIGDQCTAQNGQKGVCRKISSCSTGYTVTGACPDDPEDVKCCINADCTAASGQIGHCYNVDKVSCANGAFQKGLCPGPNNVQCCLAKIVAQPPQDSCPAIREEQISFAPDAVILSRKSTKEAEDFMSNIEDISDACVLGAAFAEAISAGVATPIALGVGLGCGLTKLVAHEIADRAEECLGKNQCLKLVGPIPFCVGGDDCCG